MSRLGVRTVEGRAVWERSGGAAGWRRAGLLVVAGLVWCCVFGGSAVAGPVWTIASVADTTVVPGGSLSYLLEIRNIGDADTSSPADPTCNPNTPPVDPDCVVLTAALPAGVTGVNVQQISSQPEFTAGACTGLGVAGPVTVVCAGSTVVSTPHDAVHGARTFVLSVSVDPGASGVLTSAFGLSGGGAAVATDTVDPTRVSFSPSGFGVDALDGLARDSTGAVFSQAGGHPFAASTSIDLNTGESPKPPVFGLPGEQAVWPIEPVKDVLVDLPPGFLANPTATEKCTAGEIAQANGWPLCPPSSQVGTTLVRVNGIIGFNNVWGPVPVFDMLAPPGVPARFGFNFAGTVVTLDGKVRSATDYGLSANVPDISEGLSLAGTTLTFWGVPADPAHDPERACPGQVPPWQGGPSCAAGTPARAFLRNPTSCTAPPGSPFSDGLVTLLHLDSWANPGRHNADGTPDFSDPAWKSASFVTHDLPGYPAPSSSWGPHSLPTGCDSVPFDPTLSATPGAPAKTASPSGFAFDVGLPQTDDPNAIGEGDLRKAVVTLPEGVRISPATADGLQACTPEQVGLDTTADPTCPEASRMGSLTITTPLLDEPVTGSVYLASPHNNPFGTLMALYLVGKGPGVIIKLPGKVVSDAGRVTATFDNNPQLPFSNLHLEFKGGPRAALMTPNECGTYTTHTQLTSWSGKVVTTDSSFTLDHGSDGGACAPLGFSPGFNAGTQDPGAGKESPFLLSLTRGDQDQELRSLTVNMPTGLLGRIASTVLCGDGPANAGTCADESKVGSVAVAAGAGSNPFVIRNGRAYITGPYKGAPFGLSIVVPAVAGPFDLGNVVVRASIFVDKHTAALRVVSDPFPTMLEGIPLDVRTVQVGIDKPKFIINPTSCAEKRVAATVSSIAGTIAHVSSRFRATDCANLPLAPKLTLKVGAKGRTKAGVSTPFSTTLTQTSGQTGLRSVSVSLPTTLNALLPVVNRACKLTEFNAGKCSNTTKVGSAVAITPLLRDPLKGSAYFVKNPSRAIPDLMVALKGQVDFDLVGKVTIPGGKHLATTFDAIPDVPITKFTLRLVSGKNGPLGTAANLCTAKSKAATAAVGFRGQNGKLLQLNQRLHISGCPKAKKAKKAKH